MEPVRRFVCFVLAAWRRPCKVEGGHHVACPVLMTRWRRGIMLRVLWWRRGGGGGVQCGGVWLRVWLRLRVCMRGDVCVRGDVGMGCDVGDIMHLMNQSLNGGQCRRIVG